MNTSTLARHHFQLTPLSAALRIAMLGIAMTGAAAHAQDPASASGAATAATLPTVLVQAAAEDGSADTAYRARNANVGVLGEKSLQDTPFSVGVYSRELMENKQARSLADLTKGDAAIGLMVEQTGAESWVGIRGIETDQYNGSKLDGLSYGMMFNELPLEHMDRVEVLKGAGGFLYGFASPGGTVNYVMKRAGAVPVRSVTTQVRDSGMLLVHGDLGGRFGAGDAFGYRVNLVRETGDTAVDGGKQRRTSGSVALDWRITPHLVWQVDAMGGDQVRNGANAWVTPSVTGTRAGGFSGNAQPPAAIDGSTRIAPGFGRIYTEFETYGSDLSWQFAPDWKLAVAYRTTEFGRELMNGTDVLANAQGVYSVLAQNFSGRLESRHAQAMVTGRLATGPVRHEVAVGVSRSASDEAASWMGGGRYESAVLGPASLANPVDFANPFTSPVSVSDAKSEFDLVRRRELFASDTLHFGADWDLIVGLRHGRLQVRDAGYNKTKTTPTVAAVFRPAAGLSLYASYVEALEQGETAPLTASNRGEVFEPLVSKQVEVGAKAEGNGWGATAALFQLKKGLSYTTPSNLFTQDGEARYQGLELAGNLRLNPQWLLTASAMWLDATNRKTDSGTLDGQRIRGVARQQASFYSEYRVGGLPLTLSAGARYFGKRPVDAFGQWDIGSVALFDAGARYETRLAGKGLTLRFNVDNLTDKAHWVMRAGRATMMQGAPRTAKLSAQLQF
ncbi:TonB-dependent siderophore receptor [Pseudoduganella sp. HUAS MS19]